MIAHEPDRQQKIEQHRDQCQRLPDFERFAFQQRARFCYHRAMLGLLHFQQPLLGGFVTLVRVGLQCLVQTLAQPLRQIRSITAGGDWRAEAAMLKGFDLAIRVVACQQVVQRDACRIQILLRMRLSAVEGFRGDVARGAGQVVSVAS